MTVNLELCDELLALERRDQETRAELAAAGVLEGGYHPRMESVHRANAARLREIVAEHGWPGRRLVGDEGAGAAWLVVHHAIGEPQFMRDGLALVRGAVACGDTPAWQAAYLEDRIAVFEGRPQRFGTQLDVDEAGRPIPEPLDGDHATVDARRAEVGLASLAERLREVPVGDPPPPGERERRDREYHAWLRRTGWRP